MRNRGTPVKLTNQPYELNQNSTHNPDSSEWRNKKSKPYHLNQPFIDRVRFQMLVTSNIKMTVWDVTFCRLDHPNGRGGKNLWNVGKILRDYRVQHPKRQSSLFFDPSIQSTRLLTLSISLSSPLTRPIACSLTSSLTNSATLARSFSLTNSLACSLTHSLTY
jgi:hypothetical protein